MFAMWIQWLTCGIRWLDGTGRSAARYPGYRPLLGRPRLFMAASASILPAIQLEPGPGTASSRQADAQETEIQTAKRRPKRTSQAWSDSLNRRALAYRH